MTSREQAKSNDAPRTAGFDPLGGILAFALPGLGHISQKRTSRGIGILVGVVGLFLGGMLLGGITVVDSKSRRVEQKLSFYGQALVGPVTFVADYVHQTSFKGYDADQKIRRHALPGETIVDGNIVEAGPGQGPPVTVAVGKVSDLGVLCGLLAGMLNLIAILDALLPDTSPSRSSTPSKPKARRERDESEPKPKQASNPKTNDDAGIATTGLLDEMTSKDDA